MESLPPKRGKVARPKAVTDEGAFVPLTTFPSSASLCSAPSPLRGEG